MKKILSIFLTLCVALSLLPVTAWAEAEDENDPVAIRVGEVSYPLSLVQFSIDPFVDIADAADETYTEEQKQEILQKTKKRLIGMAVIENKLREVGKNDFTEDEMDILRAQAASQYEQAWQQIYQDWAPVHPTAHRRNPVSAAALRSRNRLPFRMMSATVSDTSSSVKELFWKSQTARRILRCWYALTARARSGCLQVSRS